jgi:hypothetical protein
VIEGFSTFAEGTIITTSGDVIVGPISEMRLKGMRRAFKANNYVHLKDLIRTQHSDFSGFHYCHTWGLFHWAFFGPLSKGPGWTPKHPVPGKSLQLILAYWNSCITKPTTAKDFEDLCQQILGWNIDKLEQEWKAWILSLDENKDPAIENYESQTHKKATSGF